MSNPTTQNLRNNISSVFELSGPGQKSDWFGAGATAGYST